MAFLFLSIYSGQSSANLHGLKIKNMEYQLEWRTSSEGWQIRCPACHGWHRVGAIHVDRREVPTTYWTWAYDLEDDRYVKVKVSRGRAREAWHTSPMSLMLLPNPDFQGTFSIRRGRAAFNY